MTIIGPDRSGGSNQPAPASSQTPATATNAGFKQSKYHDAEIEALEFDERGFAPIVYEKPGRTAD